MLPRLAVNRLPDDSPHIHVDRKATIYGVDTLAILLTVGIWLAHIGDLSVALGILAAGPAFCPARGHRQYCRLDQHPRRPPLHHRLPHRNGRHPWRCGGFAGPVGSQKAKDLTLAHLPAHHPHPGPFHPGGERAHAAAGRLAGAIADGGRLWARVPGHHHHQHRQHTDQGRSRNRAAQRIVTPDLAGAIQPVPDWRDLGWSDLPVPPQNELSGLSQCSSLRSSSPLAEQLLNICTSSAHSSGRIPGEPLQVRGDHALRERETAV